MSQLSGYSGYFLLGCYTENAEGAGIPGSGIGLSVARRDPGTGALRLVGPPTPTPSPSFVVCHPGQPVVYAVNEGTDGAVSAFALAPDGVLTTLGTWSTGGAEPAHLMVTPDARHLLVANYASGSVASFPLDPEGRPTHRADLVVHDGSGPHPQRQTGPHAHQLVAVGDDVVAVDLGADAVLRYRLGPDGTLGKPETAATLPPGTGPRHLTVVDGTVYLVGELSTTLLWLRPDPDGWRVLGTVPASTGGGYPSEVAASRDGRFLYVGNRGPDTVSVFALGSGRPTMVGEVPTGGAWPRHLLLVDEHLYVANQNSHTVVTFRVDPGTGLPTPTGDVLRTPSPTCITEVRSTSR